jgi:hypothetical protein
VKPAVYLPVSKHAAVIASYAVLHHGHTGNLEHILLNNTKGEVRFAQSTKNKSAEGKRDEC